MNKEKFDFDRFKEEAMKGLYEGKKMGGTDGVFAPMLKRLGGKLKISIEI